MAGKVLSDKISGYIERASWIRKMFEEGLRMKAEKGERNVFDFSLGNPILEPPAEFSKALIETAKNQPPGGHSYMPNPGYPFVRERIAEVISRHHGLKLTKEHIIMTVGAAGALNTALKAILDDGDEVIVFAPYFVEYSFYIMNHGGVMKVAGTDETFLPDLASLESLLSERTRAVIINTPNNPTGRLYPQERLDELGALLERAGEKLKRIIYLICDEPYMKIIYDGKRPTSVFKAYKYSIIAHSYSKDMSIAGERIGYAAICPRIEESGKLFGGMAFTNRILGYVNAPALMQRLVAAVPEATVDVSWYETRRNRIYNALVSYGYDVVKPEGAFYFFPKSLLADDVEFVNYMKAKDVLVVPGSGFGAPGYFRLSYAVDDWVIDGGLPKFEEAAKALKGR
ncbi:MAG: pyridoxal phosphate-dependent aminotransferase [Myxococcota bacterium]